MKSAIVSVVLSGLLAGQNPADDHAGQLPPNPEQQDTSPPALPPSLPELPNPLPESPTAAPDQPQSDQQPKKKRRKAKRKKKGEPQQKTEERQKPTVQKAKRTRVDRSYSDRPTPWEFLTNYQPLSPLDRGLVVVSQLGCVAMGTTGTLAALASAALAARTLDRPAGGLLSTKSVVAEMARAVGGPPAPALPVGGLLPLLIGVAGSGAVVGLGVAWVGMLAERRLAGVAAALAVWAALAPAASTLVLAAILAPVAASTRNRFIQENVTATALVGLVLGAPLLAVVAYHVGSLIQEREDSRRHQDSVDAALEAIKQDAAKPPAPQVEPSPPASSEVAPPTEPVPTKPESTGEASPEPGKEEGKEQPSEPAPVGEQPSPPPQP